MAYTRRKFRGKLKCLLHFDYPYYGEPGDGCRDELGAETWSRQGGTKFVGTEAPNDAVVADTPKFGYRCPQFASAADFVKGTNVTGIWNLASSGDYEIELFVRPTSASAGNILTLLNGAAEVFTLAKNASNMLTLVSSAFGINQVSTAALTLNAWGHVMIRVSTGTARVYLNGTELFNQATTAGQTLAATEARIGGFAGQVDEFAFRHSARAGNPVVSPEPYQGSVNLRSLGGFGSGSYGDVTITAANVQINSYAMITGASDARTIQVGAWANGIYGAPAAGDEIMLHVSLKRGADESRLGFYAFRRIAEITGTRITLDAPVSEEFTLDAALVSQYYVQAVTVPNYGNLTVEAAATVVHPNWSTSQGGGIIAFRCSGSLRLDGKIISHNERANEIRTDSLTLCHADIIDRFVLFAGQNIFITAQNIECAENARIGKINDGSKQGGAPGRGFQQGGYTAGVSGGTGYGGGGGGGGFESGGAGEVGRGGKGGRGTGGASPGGRPGRNGIWMGSISIVCSGPNIIIVAKNVKLPGCVVSNGGSADGYSQYDGGGGAGSGLCFLAWEEAV